MNTHISKNTIKFIRSLNLKKFRDQERCFVAEGPKVVSDLLPLISCRTLYATEDFLKKTSRELLKKVGEVVTITNAELERISLLRTPREAIAVFDFMPETQSYESLTQLPVDNLCLALDGVQDPGNLGTILRVADWFGIEHVFASHETADIYSPKVVQATMGAIGRVQLHYLDLPKFVTDLPENTPVYGTFLDGNNLYSQSLQKNGLIVMGNEGKGISKAIGELVTERLLIPNYPPGRPTSESLNVAIATAIVCAAFRQ